MQNPTHNPGSGNSSFGSNSPTEINTQSNSAQKPKSSSATAREFHSFIADIEELLKTTTNLSGEDLDKAKVKFQERITAARESIAEISESLGPRAREAVAVTDNYVHQQPWKAIGISAVAGLLSGYLLNRR